MSSYFNLTKSLIVLRTKRNISRRQIAEHLSISVDLYRKIENGESPINLERLLKICDFFEVDLRDFLDLCLDTKSRAEYEAEINRLNAVLHQVLIERDNLWSLVHKLIKMLDSESSDQAFRMMTKIEAPMAQV